MYFFVYGTLKRGGRLDYHMRGATFIGPAMTKDPDYGMIDLGAFPGVVEVPESIHIHGELYEGPPELLDRLDMVEGYPYMYCRKEVPVAVGLREYTAVIYLYRPHPDRAYTFLESGEWDIRR